MVHLVMWRGCASSFLLWYNLAELTLLPTGQLFRSEDILAGLSFAHHLTADSSIEIRMFVASTVALQPMGNT